ncbi:MAG: diacylglycerol kinase family lipid kinase [Calditrichaeota bacterium]|nr:diacylglycerol kinase family lipid kinase [Calditrichota bacterium]
MSHILFVVNPVSGINRKPEKLIAWIHEIFSKASVDYQIQKTRYQGHGVKLAREGARQGARIVVAVGGDGTINEVARGLLNTDTALGVVPAGSGNGFARNFHIPLNQKKAIEGLLQVDYRWIDVGRINSHFFVNVAGMGLDAVISANFERFGMRGPLPYFIVGVREYFRYRPRPVELFFDGRRCERHPLLLSVANAPQYGNGAVIAPQAIPDDGFLDLCILSPLPLWRTVINLHRLFTGTIHEVDAMEIYRVKSVVVERADPGYIHTDGDPHLEGRRLEIEVLANKLKLALPRGMNP